ncbi:MAG: SUF system Fe-S cluster assembly regulator [Pseudomonadales bacterium]
MLRISRFADYGLLVINALCQVNQLTTLEQLSEKTKLTMPTIYKIMRSLVKSGLVISLRGVNGGYKITKSADQISIAEIIEAVDGPIALTDCTKGLGCQCVLEGDCQLKGNWQLVNQQVIKTLGSITLDMMNQPVSQNMNAGTHNIAAILI